MLYLRDLWRRHRRKVLVTAGVLGSGYLLYKLYDAHKRRLTDLERQLANERENDEFIKAQMQLHFENIQRIADTTTLPHAMPHLSCQIAEDLNLSHLMERLVKEKDQPNSLSSLEKLELWDSLKILSFTRMVVSIWAVTILSLYIRVQVNILGRYLYIDIARGLGSSYLLKFWITLTFSKRVSIERVWGSTNGGVIGWPPCWVAQTRTINTLIFGSPFLF
ncbi:hypothetical protein E1A91_D08G149900v1 [Gossypium mustelinum]|uniref:Peroxin-3 n=1 Tax=Gossypium mustelinum TaxID=34275 RepID=A0A5D2TYD3_GOSMU|nr:hypothetical protein E1A91_D08G149900v1 [Gossypium mustelinum]